VRLIRALRASLGSTDVTYGQCASVSSDRSARVAFGHATRRGLRETGHSHKAPADVPSRSCRGGRDRASSPSGATPVESRCTQPEPLRLPRCWLGCVRPEAEEPVHRARGSCGFHRPGPRCPPFAKPLRARAVGNARVPRVDCARSAGAAALHRPHDRIAHSSLRHGKTHRGEDRPAASRHGAPHRVRVRGDHLSRIVSGTGSQYPESRRVCPRPWCGFAKRLQHDDRRRVPGGPEGRRSVSRDRKRSAKRAASGLLPRLSSDHLGR
jgi:hypothetical protein